MRRKILRKQNAIRNCSGPPFPEAWRGSIAKRVIREHLDLRDRAPEFQTLCGCVVASRSPPGQRARTRGIGRPEPDESESGVIVRPKLR